VYWQAVILVVMTLRQARRAESERIG